MLLCTYYLCVLIIIILYDIGTFCIVVEIKVRVKKGLFDRHFQLHSGYVNKNLKMFVNIFENYISHSYI